MDLSERVLAGDRRAAGRLITLIEEGAPAAERALERLAPHLGRAHVVGVTGPAGSGKSTLVRGVARELRTQGRQVGIVAVDPTSPLTGGAVLGDRIRMQDLTGDPGVFIRSMASRGASGGLARATRDAVKVLDAFGFDVVLVETVGAGQGEVDVARAGHTTVVVQVPGMGDEIQAIKAGILEVADLLVVNKADVGDADRTVFQLKALVRRAGEDGGWIVPVLKTVATTGQGIPEVVAVLNDHRRHLRESGELRTRLRGSALRELLDVTKEELAAELRAVVGEPELETLAEAVVERRLAPRAAAKELVRRFRASCGGPESDADRI